MKFRIRAGMVTGRSHLLDVRNCQDALCHTTFEVQGQPYYIGVIADGCGASRHSEVGAQLAVQFMGQMLKNALLGETPLASLPEVLLTRLVAFLERLCDAYEFPTPLERAQFVREHLLFTLIGFVVSPDQVLVLASGDGVVLLNDTVHPREQNNTPAYIGYHLIEPQYMGGQSEVHRQAFECYELPTTQLRRLAIGSDAWLHELPLLNEVWEHSGVAGLQLRMNRWSSARHFHDDASMVLLERIQEGE